MPTPLPRIDACFHCLIGTEFLVLYLRSSQRVVAGAEKTPFISQQGLFEYLVMPFELTNAPATFERLMEKEVHCMSSQTN